MRLDVVRLTRQRLGPVGVWLFGGDPTPVREEREALGRLERLGYGSAWMGESLGGRDAFARSGVFLAATERLAVGTGIANVWARHPVTAQAAGRTLAEAHPGRFVLGLGVGHAFQAQQVGESFQRPLSRLRDYLSTMDEEAAANPPAEPFARVLAAIGPKMLELSRTHADGAHPFFAPLEHTAFARQILGPDRLLIPHQAVLLESDPVRARAIARESVRLAITRGAPAYARAWQRFGYADDIADTTDRLVDAAVAWGDEEAIARRVRAQLDAGADHVLVSPTGTDLSGVVDQLTRLAPALREISRDDAG
ncbi:TIGR03620 family F420-dependent LLM class oxidoreductase [Goodfellowiella coeruleoviolacea]|uniref:F420-dependent oxidoreductase, MSMEG_4141 family n=1 Tax=Goodfellowiella coeruleoviolacea TaxID=334858 RepID=A0AAE3GCN2_9PSEU|nr:TIGR03620 family F420-dependent LLM class oxidoreductase [Goodfellowiella coeruleoviolacea]MCP2165348.1 putative F420-dependent oxidoreductase, MSMEG_4141 family [Goodfellowiella coeruleoviolacea]